MHLLKFSVLVAAALASAVVIVPAAPGTAAPSFKATNAIGHITRRSASNSSNPISLGSPDVGLLFTMSSPGCIPDAGTQVFALSSSEGGCIPMSVKNRQSFMWTMGVKHNIILSPPCQVYIWSGEDCRGSSKFIHPFNGSISTCGNVKYGSVSWSCPFT